MIYIDILTVGTDSTENFTSILCLGDFYFLLLRRNRMKMKTGANEKLSKKVFLSFDTFKLHAQFYMESYFFKDF